MVYPANFEPVPNGMRCSVFVQANGCAMDLPWITQKPVDNGCTGALGTIF